MCISSSDLIVARAILDKRIFPNLARHGSMEDNPDVNSTIRKELEEAGIEVYKVSPLKGEVPSNVLGVVHRWSFYRAWKYYIANGPGIPPDLAEQFHKEWGTQCRVDGHCGCPSPLEWFEGFAVSNYHIDTQAGLNAFVKLLEKTHKPRE